MTPCMVDGTPNASFWHILDRRNIPRRWCVISIARPWAPRLDSSTDRCGMTLASRGWSCGSRLGTRPETQPPDLPMSGLAAPPDDRFVAEERVLDPRLLMIPSLFLPGAPPDLPDSLDDPIAHLRPSSPVARPSRPSPAAPRPSGSLGERLHRRTPRCRRRRPPSHARSRRAPS